MEEQRLLKSYTLRLYANKSNGRLSRLTLGRHTGMGGSNSFTVKKQTVLFFKLLFNIFQMLDELFDFLGDSEN